MWVSDYFTYSIIICRSDFYSWHWLHNHLLCPSHTKLLHSYRWIWFYCLLIWEKCHLTHLKTPERRCTTIPVVLPLCYAPHVTEPHKRRKLSILHGRHFFLRHYNFREVLAFSTNSFHLGRFLMQSLQFVIFIFVMSLFISSSHLFLGLPSNLVTAGDNSYNFFLLCYCLAYGVHVQTRLVFGFNVIYDILVTNQSV